MIHALVAILAGLAAPCALAIPIARSDGSMATIVVSKDGGNATFSPQYNYMIEDINNSIDGGWYAEMLQNRAFQVVDPANQTTALYGWQALDGTITVTNSTSPVSTALPNSLKVTVPSTFENLGYWGMKIDSSWTYDLSFWAKAKAGSSLTVTASLESTTNPVSFGSATFSNLTTEWTEYTAKMTPSENGCNLNNTLRFKVEGDASEVDFALFSLFPPTYKGRKNGARIDITEAVAATHPSGLRFPGGNNIEGQVISQRWIWNNTIGPLVDRPGRMGDWSYPNDDGMGLMEYLDLIEDLGIEGIMGVWAGYALEGETVNATDLGPYVQTAIDQIEFAIGAADTTYGKMRADLGHPEPYNVPYVEIGNEDFFASKSYVDYRWAAFHDAIQARFPDLKILATTYPETKLSPEPKYLDAHVYQTPEWFFENKNLYDNYNRSSFKIFEGEYAVTGTNESCLYGDVSCGRLRWSTMEAACGEAAFMTGLERNSDLVFAAAYAPMLENINRHQWSPNLIGFDAGNVYLSASYYIQKLFSVYRGDSVLPFTIEENLPAGTNSSLAVVVSHASDEDKTFVKLVNFGNATRSVTLDFTAFSTESTSVSIDYVVASNGVRTAANVPGQEVLVQNQVMQTTTDKGMLVYEMPAWSVAVVNSCFRND